MSPIAINPNVFTGAIERDNEVTAFLLPDYLVEVVV